MSKTEQQHREDIVQTGRMMFERGWIAGTDGNLTVRLDAERILSTPAGACKGRMCPEDLLICDLNGNRIAGHRNETTEMAMHVAIYRARPDVNAVVHAHPPIATGFAVAGRPLNLGLMPELIVTLGAVPLAEYGLPGTSALVDGMLPYLSKFDAILLANHGAVAYGADLFSAFCRMDTVEHFAHIALVAEMLGGPKVLPRVEIQKLFDSRARYGIQSHNSFEPGWPVAAEDFSLEDVADSEERPGIRS